MFPYILNNEFNSNNFCDSEQILICKTSCETLFCKPFKPDCFTTMHKFKENVMKNIQCDCRNKIPVVCRKKSFIKRFKDNYYDEFFEHIYK